MERYPAADADKDGKTTEKISPLTYAAKKQPPTLMFIGTADSLKEGADVYRDVTVKARV